MTLLIQVVEDTNKLEPLKDEFKMKFKNTLRNNAAALKIDNRGFKMKGAFEIDLKYYGLLTHASLRSIDLLKKLGLNRTHNRSQDLLHFHAIVGALDDEHEDKLKLLIGKSLDMQLLPSQVHFKSLHKTNTKNDNLRNLASYMFKARLQYADNIFDDNFLQKKASYKTPFKDKVLIDYLNAVDAMGNFNGLKFDYGL
jgi:hypothetical protein